MLVQNTIKKIRYTTIEETRKECNTAIIIKDINKSNVSKDKILAKT